MRAKGQQLPPTFEMFPADLFLDFALFYTFNEFILLAGVLVAQD